MKKTLILLIIFCICISSVILYNSQKQTLSAPRYPITADDITEALEQCGLSYTVKQEDWGQEHLERTVFTLRNDENENFFSIGILSGLLNNKRLLTLTFAPHDSHGALPANEFEDSIVLATVLFGGFKSNREVYDKFVSEYDTVNTQRQEYDISANPSVEASSRWETEIGGVLCRIDLSQPKLNEDNEYIKIITLTDDVNTFFPE